MPAAHVQAVFWNENKPAHTYFLDGISLLLPHGEAFMVETLAELDSQRLIPKKLKTKIEQFVAEENRHSQAHIRYNERLKIKGYDVDAFEQYIHAEMNKMNALPLREKLIVCCALEVLTSYISKKLLRSPTLLTQEATYETKLWTWHCREEIEHASSMMELYQHIIGSKRHLLLAVPLCAIWLLADLRKLVSSMASTDKLKRALETKQLCVSLGKFCKDFLVA